MDSARLKTLKDDLVSLAVRISRLKARDYLAPSDKRDLAALEADSRRIGAIVERAEQPQIHIDSLRGIVNGRS